MENMTITLPVWAVSILVGIYCIEKVISLKLCQRIIKFILRIWIFIRYHNDVEYYKDCKRRKETLRRLSRERASRGGKYNVKLPKLNKIVKKEKDSNETITRD